MEEQDYSSSSSEQKLSKFDSTIAVLMRIDQLWKDAHRHSRDANFMRWNFDLDRVYVELYADANPDEKKKFKDFNEKVVKNKNNKNALYEILLEKECFLKDLEKKQGKGVGYEDSLEEYAQR